MTPGLREKMCAYMRLAFTRACVTFPKVDPNPITSALWKVYSAVAYELGSTYPLGSPAVAMEIESLTETGIAQILAKGDLAAATAGMSPQQTREFASVGMGLDQATAMHLYRYRQRYRKDFLGIQTQRKTALESRRNNLANQLVDIAAQQAKITMSQMERGEATYAEYNAG